MKLLQLYIEGERIDLFKDETVSLTDSIQNVKDIEKVFTSFTKSFSIPGSKTNNKIFKHYYKFDITNTFDARVKVDARIEINYQTFRTGKIKLEGVDLKNNKPHTYRITFFGDIVDLKDTLGERKLNSLIELSSYNLDYDANTVYNKLGADPTTNDVIAPLITHSQSLYYEDGAHGIGTGNLWYESGAGTSHHHGVNWNQLKYALRVNKIIEAIEDQYDNIEFSSDFFKNTSVTEMNNLFMWLHRKSGAVEDLSGGTISTEIVTGWTPDFGNQAFSMYTDALLINGDPQYFLNLELDIYPSSPSVQYSVDVQVYGQSVYQSGNVTGNLTGIDLTNTITPFAWYEIYITTSGVLSFNNIQWTVEYQAPNQLLEFDTFSNTTFSTSGIFVFNVNRQMPDIKIIDFLSGLFKLFNLTAYVDNGVIVVKKLDDYYASSTKEWDITKYIDKEKTAVNAALPYKEIVFKYKDTKYFLANKFSQLNNRNWGELYYNQGRTDFAGGLYKVEVPFGHMLYERITDRATQTLKDIQWGYCVNESQNAYLGAPLLFYPILTDTDTISFIDDLDEDGVPQSHTSIVNVNLPFNSVTNNSATNDFQLNFNLEFSEWTGTVDFTDTLFQDFYSDYIVSTFDLKQRITKVTAYLPQSILMNYNLADIFVIGGNKYRINSITTNLLTNKSEIELLNVL